MLGCECYVLFMSLSRRKFHPVLEDKVRVEEESVLSSKSASKCGYISVRSKLVAKIFLPKESLVVLFVEVRLAI